MLALRNPHDAYRRVEFDARVAGARPDQLVGLCYEELAMALGSAIRADELGDNQRRSAGLTRALAALTALQLGVDRNAPGAEPLLKFYEGVRRAVLASVPSFRADRLAAIREDVKDVARAIGSRTDASISE